MQVPANGKSLLLLPQVPEVRSSGEPDEYRKVPASSHPLMIWRTTGLAEPGDVNSIV
jgi:hypothetical protein